MRNSCKKIYDKFRKTFGKPIHKYEPFPHASGGGPDSDQIIIKTDNFPHASGGGPA